MRKKEFEFFSVYTRDFGSKGFRHFEKWWNVWGKAVLVALLFILGILWWQAVMPQTFSREEMRDYAVVYLNSVQ